MSISNLNLSYLCESNCLLSILVWTSFWHLITICIKLDVSPLLTCPLPPHSQAKFCSTLHDLYQWTLTPSTDFLKPEVRTTYFLFPSFLLSNQSSSPVDSFCWINSRRNLLFSIPVQLCSPRTFSSPHWIKRDLSSQVSFVASNPVPKVQRVVFKNADVFITRCSLRA